MASLSLNKIVSQAILSKTENVCSLCFKVLEGEISQAGDIVVLEVNNRLHTEDISNVLVYVLGSQFKHHLEIMGPMCQTCTNSAISSYKFIKQCSENSKQLSLIADALNYCFDNTADQIDMYKSLYVPVDIKGYSTKQFYDLKPINSSQDGYQRFRQIIQLHESCTSALQKKNQAVKKKSKPARNKLRDKSFLQICELVEEAQSATKFKCLVCLNVFNKSYNFKKHYYSQHCPKVFKCSECTRGYGSEALLRQHKYDCHSDMMCGECGKRYTNRYSLLYHLRRHTGEEPYECQYCHEKFQWSSRRAEHIRRFHLEPSVECDICHTKFKTLSSLYDHRKRHFNPNSRLHVDVVPEEVTEETMITDWQMSVEHSLCTE